MIGLNRWHNPPWRGLVAAAAALSAICIGAIPVWAAAGPPPSDGRAVGVFSAAVLLGLVLYSVFLVCQPLLHDEGGGLIWAFLLLIAIAVIKIAVLPICPGLGIDVGSYQSWALRMSDVGPGRMYEQGYFLDYPPGYLYLLWAAGAAVQALGLSGDMARAMVETPAVLGDLLIGGLIFATVRRSSPAVLAYAAMALFALNPATLYDSVIWGQSDSIPALFMLLATLMLLQDEYELGWGLVALAVLTKPQALALAPVLGLWTLLKGGRAEWLRSALAFIAFGLVVIAPFQIGHPWSWLYDLYTSTTGYYHETSVNAFNLLALAGGLRVDDSTTVLRVSYFMMGMAALAVLYAFVAYLLWEKPGRDRLMLTAFLALMGFFVLAPRMHERYLYPALVFVIPLAVESPILLGVLGVLTVTFLFNLVYVKHILEADRFLDARDTWAMIASGINVAALGVVVWYGWTAISGTQSMKRFSELWRRVGELASEEGMAAETVGREGYECPRWERLDTIAVTLFAAAAALTRLYRLGFPNEIVFDEVHFVGQARHYLHGESFLDPHPPLAKLLIASAITLFGDHAWSWRVPNALLGIALVAITFMLARRMFNSRLIGTLAALFVLCDGMFVVDSRIAVLDIVYVTFGAWAYLLFFRFIQTPARDPARRWTLVWMAIALGLCLSAKLYVPAVTFLLVLGFLIYVLIREQSGQAAPVAAPAENLARRTRRSGPRRAAGPAPPPRQSWDPMLERRIGGAVALVGGVSAIVYLVVFLPHFLLGWWGGIADLFKYYNDVIWYEDSVASATHPYSAPWWSWPFMLRPIAYWQDFPSQGEVVKTIWGGGNPASWWGAVTAIVIVAVQAVERRSLPRAFLAIGYAAYLSMWIPIGRTLFLYHYMPAVYLGYIALAVVLAECWERKALLLERAALLFTLVPVLLLGLGVGVGLVVSLAMLATFAALLGYKGYDGKFVCVAFVGVVLILFIYYLPVWIGLPISRTGYYARMWLSGPGIKDWI